MIVLSLMILSLAVSDTPTAPSIPTLNPFVALFIGASAGILTAGAAGYVAIRKVRSEVTHTEAQTDSSRAEAAQTIVNAAKALVEPLREQAEENKYELRRQGERIDQQEDRIDRLENHIDVLEAMMREVGLVPPLRPR